MKSKGNPGALGKVGSENGPNAGNHSAKKAGVETGLSEHSKCNPNPDAAGMGTVGGAQLPMSNPKSSAKKYGKSFKVC